MFLSSRAFHSGVSFVESLNNHGFRVFFFAVTMFFQSQERKKNNPIKCILLMPLNVENFDF